MHPELAAAGDLWPGVDFTPNVDDANEHIWREPRAGWNFG